MNFAKGYKTYSIAAIGVALGAYAGAQPYFNLPPIPGFVYIVLGFTGLYTARSGITTDTQKAVGDVLAQITNTSAVGGGGATSENVPNYPFAKHK